MVIAQKKSRSEFPLPKKNLTEKYHPWQAEHRIQEEIGLVLRLEWTSSWTYMREEDTSK